MTADPHADWWIVEPPRNIADLLVHHAVHDPQRPMMSRRTGSDWTPVTAADLRRQVEDLALGLIEAGVQIGDRVALMSKTRYEWTLADLAIWATGAVGVPVYESSSAEQLEWILTDSQAVALIVENRGHVQLFEQIAAGCPLTTRIWSIEEADGVVGLESLIETGARYRVDHPDLAAGELQARRDATTAQSPATVIYTSGTTGRPKGVCLSHGNFLAEVSAAVRCLPELFDDPNASTLLFLPLAHVFGRMIEVAVVLKGVHTGHSNVARITLDLPTFAPTFVLAVPRVFERVYDGARRKAVKAGRTKIFDGAADTAIRYSKALDGRGPGLPLKLLHKVYAKLVYGKITAALGGSAQWAVAGGAALGPRLGHFFRGIGVTVLEGYGLTETTAAATVNTPSAQRIGTVGRALPGFEVRIGADGEVLLRGGHVFSGYWRNEQASAEAFDEDGWFRTGDLGSLDEDGFLSITGRKKEILVTSAGKNVSPAPLEDGIRACPLVSQALVVGDGRAQINALVTLDAEAVAAWLDQQGRPPAERRDLVDDPALRAEIKKYVEAANRGVSSAEAVKKFKVLADDWTEANGMLTPSLKLRRSVIIDALADDIEALYTRST